MSIGSCLVACGGGGSSSSNGAEKAGQVASGQAASSSSSSSTTEIASCQKAIAQNGSGYLRGVNFSGQEYTPGQQWPVAAAVPYYIGQKKMTVIRLPIKWELLQPSLNGALSANMVTGIEDQIRRITDAGGAVILDIHNGGRREVNGLTYVVGETSQVTSADFSDLWKRIAGQWGNRCGVIFDLMNEPHEQDDATLLTVTNAAISAIRGVGARNFILVNGNDWGSAAWKPGAKNYSFIGAQVVDPIDNMAFDIHHYFDDSSGTHAWCNMDTWQDAFHAFTAWARANHKRAFVGEFAAGDNPVCDRDVTEFLDFIDPNPDIWLGWTWWGGGGWWNYGYDFRLDPYASRWDVTNPQADASINWDNPTDVDQMTLLSPYLK